MSQPKKAASSFSNAGACEDADIDAYLHQPQHKENPVRTTVTIEDALYQQALDVADPTMDKADLFREAIKTFIRVRAAKRLAALGATEPDMQNVPRRQAAPAQ
ncbi:hypothetical protein ACFONG_19850 [Uliginosibacterium paludis]|uniref:CopG family transcriptional regulator n=1 Tax=Uliginosibacterium paludis TaxID=1615952 RepID=A0ABV2CUU5_9RHOO